MRGGKLCRISPPCETFQSKTKEILLPHIIFRKGLFLSAHSVPRRGVKRTLTSKLCSIEDKKVVDGLLEPF